MSKLYFLRNSYTSLTNIPKNVEKTRKLKEGTKRVLTATSLIMVEK